MALQGKIDDFGLADIFQLIGQQQRSGVLTIRSEDRTAEISFSNGMISRANPIYLSPKRDPLGNAAVRARLIREEDLQKAAEKQDETMKSLDEVFASSRLLSREQIRSLNDMIVIETLYDSLQWKSGEYEFNVKELAHDDRFSTLTSVEHLLLDVLRMVDEESELSVRIPSLGIVFQKTLEGAESPNIGQDLGAYEELVYGLVDGVKSAQEIIDQSILGHYNASKALVNLLDAGHIKKTSIQRAYSAAAAPGEQKRLTTILYGAIPLIVIALLVGFRVVSKPSGAEGSPQSISAAEGFARVERVKIENALTVYFLDQGKFPGQLEELVEAHLLRPDELRVRSGVAFQYSLQADGRYRLE
jgi:hypothetical protein